jgi:hypothetical protein
LIIERTILPSAMAMALGIDGHTTSAGYQMYLERLRQQAGRPTDPVELMLLEHLALCHFRAAVLHGQAGEAGDLDGVRVYSEMAARLTGEFRKLVVTLQAYRAAAPARDGPPQAPVESAGPRPPGGSAGAAEPPPE